MLRSSLASLLVTSLVLTSTASAGGKARPKKAPKKKAAPAEKAPPAEGTPTPTPDGAPTTEKSPDGLGDPAGEAAAAPPAPVPQTPAAPTGPAPGSPEAKAKAKELQKQATQLYNVQQFFQAAELYQQAYLLDPNPAYLYASAQSQRLGGDCTKALQSYQAYLRANPPESEKAKAQANIERCEQDLREREAAVNADQVTVPVYDVPPPPPPPPEDPIIITKKIGTEKSYMVGHVLVGLGVVAMGGGAFLYYKGRKSLQDHNDSATYDDFQSGVDDVDAAKKNQLIGLLVGVGGLGLIGGAIAYYVIHSRSAPDAESPPPIQPTVTAKSASVTFNFTF